SAGRCICKFGHLPSSLDDDDSSATPTCILELCETDSDCSPLFDVHSSCDLTTSSCTCTKPDYVLDERQQRCIPASRGGIWYYVMLGAFLTGGVVVALVTGAIVTRLKKSQRSDRV